MKIGLTGPNGMIGQHMKALFDRENINCVCVGRDEWDLTNWISYNELDSIFSNVDAVFHFGAALPISNNDFATNIQTQQISDANVRSCLNLSEWANLREIPLVFLSGSTVYKDTNAISIKENDPKVINGFGGFYGYSKLLAEEVICHYADAGLMAIILRPSSVYGVGLGKDKLLQKYLSKAMNNELIDIQQPDNRINLIHAYDVVQAALSAFKNESWGIFNIAAANAETIEHIATTCIKLVGTSSTASVSNDSEKYQAFTRFDLDCTKANQIFKYKPQVNLIKGLEMMKNGEFLVC